MCSVYIIRLSLVKSLSWKWINTGPVSVLIKIFITKMSNKNFSALRINKILIACFDLLAGLSLDWLTSIHLPESSSICVHFWEILSFFFFFCHCWTISGGLLAFYFLQAQLNGRHQQILHLNLKYSMLSLQKKKKSLCMSSNNERMAFGRSWKGEKGKFCIFISACENPLEG